MSDPQNKKEPAKMEEYEKLRKELHEQIIKKRDLDKELAELEETLYSKETEYLRESTYGNIIKGFDNFTKTSATNNKKKLAFTDDDRIFSLSSSSFVKHLRNKNSQEDDYDDNDSSGSTPCSSSNSKKRKKDA